MVDDASAGALQLAFSGDDTWIDRSVDIARSTLSEINRSAAPDRWIAANITLGRALRLKAEKRFDPVMLREGIAHLTEALEALRSEPRLKLAESPHRPSAKPRSSSARAANSRSPAAASRLQPAACSASSASGAILAAQSEHRHLFPMKAEKYVSP